MLMRFTSLLLVLLLVLSGCSHTSQTTTSAWLKRGVKVQLPAAYLDHPLQRQQLLTAKVANRTDSLMTLLDVQDGHVILAGLSPMGIRLFKATYDGHTIVVEQHIQLAELPPANQVLADIMLSYWPLSAWQPLLPKGWKLIDKADKRLLIDDKEQLISEITYQQMVLGREPISINNHYFNYFISIQNMDD